MGVPVRVGYPRRFLSTLSVNRRVGWALRLIVGEPDPALLGAIGRRLLERDEVGAALVAAMRSRGPDRVTMAQFQVALAEGVSAVSDAPGALREFFAAVERVPEWVDFDLVNLGGRVSRGFGRNATDVLLQLALIGSYRFGGPPDLLVETGGLTGERALRRLAETQHWVTATTGPDAMRRDGVGFRLTVHVRLMHALLNDRFSGNGRWDVSRWGLPVNQADQAATLGLFNAVQLLGVRMLGVRVTREESRAVMHLWRYVGWLMGVDEDWLCDSERRQHRFNYHLLLTQSYGSPGGPQLARAAVEAQRRLHFRCFASARRAYARARLLSMLRYFIGRRGMRDLGLPVALPWAVPPVVVGNVVRYHVLGRTAVGRAYLQRRGERWARTILYRYFGDDVPAVGDAPNG